ncbi:MAG: hypothetical protein PVSMB7_29540 [Chloroflexota bacterium]
MTDATDVLDVKSHRDSPDEQELTQADAPSNEVHARVGDVVLRAARNGVRHGMRPEEIIRQIVADHNVRLNVGELRLLLASRSRTQDIAQPRQTYRKPASDATEGAE